MLEHWYKSRRTLLDFRRGPLGPYFDDFALYVKNSGYSHSTGRDILSRACDFNVFLIEKGITNCKSISRKLIDPFTDIYHSQFRSTCLSYNPRFKSRGILHQLFFYLEKKGLIKAEPQKPVSTRFSWILTPYLKHLRETDLIEQTIQQSHTTAENFLLSIDKRLDTKVLRELKADIIEEFLNKFLKKRPENMRCLIGQLRRFLRFCAAKKFMASDYSNLFPSVPAFRGASLPKGLEDSEIQRLIDIIPKNNPTGARDYAMALLMIAYGIRAKSLSELLMEDINWQRSTIRFHAQKGGKEVLVPLLESVGEAIIAYLRYRPQSQFRNVFLTMHAPIRPIKINIINRIMGLYMIKAGVKKSGIGAYALRHSWAIRALAHDSSIKSIADILRASQYRNNLHLRKSKSQDA